jgi:hypothetical protein
MHIVNLLRKFACLALIVGLAQSMARLPKRCGAVGINQTKPSLADFIVFVSAKSAMRIQIKPPIVELGHW